MLILLTAAALIAPAAASPQSAGQRSVQLQVSGSQRIRYEHLWNQFVQRSPGNDQAVSLRTEVAARLSFESLGARFELIDSRVYLADDDTPLSVSHVNPIDILQAYLTASIPDLFVHGSELEIKLGRQTMNVGSRKLVAGNTFRNTTNSLNGLHALWGDPQGRSIRAFVTVPVQRRVFSIRDNKARLDKEQFNTLFWGLQLGKRVHSAATQLEILIIGLHEEDSDQVETSNRSIATTGFRMVRSRAPGQVDFEIETVAQAGRSRNSDLPSDTTDLTHLAWFLHTSIGFTLLHSLQPRVFLEYSYASGDEDPTDDKNGRFDTLYGARRFDYGPTGIYGPFARSNLKSPGVGIAAGPSSDWRAFLRYRAFWLAQNRDYWPTTGIRDPNGLSGSFLGCQIEGAARWNWLPDRSTIEAGFARVRLGDFPKNAPNGYPEYENPLYFYTQLTLRF